MSLRWKYFLFIGIVHAVIAALAYQYLKEQKLYFILSELAIITSLGLAYLLYRSFIRPVEFMYSGVDAIQDKDFNIKFVPTGSKEMDKLIGVYNAMIDNLRIERTQVEEQHYFMMKLINASPTGIIILDFDGKIAEINPKALEMFQLRKDVVGKQLLEIDNFILQQITTIEDDTSKIISTEGFGKFKCQTSQFIHRGFKRKFILIQELSKEILEAEKRAYEKIIRMMAHEVNNSIGAINSILHSHLEFFTQEEDEKESLKIAIARNDSMNQFMKNFAKVVRLPEPNLERTEINELLQRIGKLMELQAQSKNITIDFQLYPSSIFANLDERHLEQVLVNIIKNAIESIGENGKIQLITQASPATILIRDNGAGITPEAAEKLFTPFFSTKLDGQGVGLTLIREVLLNHDAQFSLKTVEDGWTEFRIAFKN